MRVVVDMEICASTGMCERSCPEVFEVGADGLLHVLDSIPPESLHSAVREAAQFCPTGAISLEETGAP